MYSVGWLNDQIIFTRIDAIATGCYFAIYHEQIIEKLALTLDVIFLRFATRSFCRPIYGNWPSNPIQVFAIGLAV
jgi:hypothetical protein